MVREHKSIPDQDAIIVASDYDITNWGLTPPNLPKKLTIIDPETREEKTIKNPTEEDK